MWEIPGVEIRLFGFNARDGDGDGTLYCWRRSGAEAWSRFTTSSPPVSTRPAAGATLPLIKVRTIDDVPVLGLTLFSEQNGSERYDSFELRRIAAELRKEIAAVDDVSEVRLIGGERRQVRVLLDSARMAATGVDPAAIAAALTMQNAASPAGSFAADNREVLVETGAFLTGVGEVADLVVALHDGRPVYLRDVAEIVDGAEEPRNLRLFPHRHDGIDAGGDRRRRQAPGRRRLPRC